MIQKTKISYQYFIKKLFNLLNKEIKILLTLFLFSCSNNSVKSEDISPEKIFCGASTNQSVDKNVNFISKKSKNFENILASIDKDLNKDSFNLLVFSGSKPSSGHKLKLNNIKKKNSTYYLNFINIKPLQGSTNLAVITYPYCVLKVENFHLESRCHLH